MQSNWDLFFSRVLKDEGTTYEDDPSDSGGPTKCGITIADVARWHGLKIAYDKKGKHIRGAADWDKCVQLVKALDPAKASEIYKKFYWDEVRADDLPHGVDYMVTDYAVNSGPGRAVPTLGALVGCRGGKVTDDMIQAVRKFGSYEDLIHAYQDARRAYLTVISEPPTYAKNVKYRKGWLAREARVRKIALDLASNNAPPTQITTLPKAVTPALAPDLPPPGEATAKDLRQHSKKLSLLSMVRSVAKALGFGTLMTESFNFSQTVNESKGVANVVQEVLADPVLLGVVVVVVVVVGLVAVVEHWHVQDYNEGRYIPSGRVV